MDKKMIMRAGAVFLIALGVGAGLGLVFTDKAEQAYTNRCVELLGECQEAYRILQPTTPQEFMEPMINYSLGYNGT